MFFRFTSDTLTLSLFSIYSFDAFSIVPIPRWQRVSRCAHPVQ